MAQAESQGGQFLARQTSPARLDVDPSAYFGAHPDGARNAGAFGVRRDPNKDQELCRVSYLYLLVFSTEYGSTEYGGMQLRAETHLWLEDGSVPVRLQKILQRTAHRAAYVFDSATETPAYGANEWASGYLSGFDPWENGHDYENWEVEPVARGEVHNPPGVIDWSTEIYLEVDGLEYADLSGVATGLADPWRVEEWETDGQAAVDIPSTKWHIGFEDSWGDYFARPEPGTQASSRYLKDGAGGGKDVYINGLKVGSLGPKARVRINPEYQIGDGLEYRGSWSREGLVQETVATYQAIRRGGRLYQTGETEDEVHLVTARAKPDGWESADPDSVPVDLEARAGEPSRLVRRLRLDQPEDPTRIIGKEDREVISHMGLSTPPWQHDVGEMFRWPGFVQVMPWNVKDDGRDGDQSGLDDYGGGGA